MAGDGKFGTFAGVFTPSLLTILGVIMYLRLPWMVGQAGLVEALGIVIAAHVVSVATGLSVSSIATDKKVGAGGPYYIISRSFGLPIGGAIGVALFLGLSFSVSLYLVGFSQSLLSTLDIEPTANAIRVCGSLTLVSITVITFVSTSLALKAQYVVLALVAGSLASVLLGRSTTSAVHMSAAADAPSFGVLFGIFFPAVTGFMAGVNMSGDLRDPKGAIPLGTMLAIATGFAVYAGLVVYLAYTTDPAALRDDQEVLQHTAWVPQAVIGGIWGATLSSALGSILGAPRILQAMSSDRITPRAFAKGYGPTKEPRNALVVAFVIAEAGILIAELDLIARVVSMVFLALYGAINVTCVIESWASPDFRPRFRIPKLVSLIGAVSALLLMIQLDILAMLGATVLMVGLFAYLKRRQLTLEAGDTWEGVWATLVRAGLHRMHKQAGTRRNWRPNVLLFDDAEHPRHGEILNFATTLASGNGIVSDFALAAPVEGEETIAAPPLRTEHVGVFTTRVVTGDPLGTVATLCQYHGFSGLPPNTLLLPWRQQARDPGAFLRTLDVAAGRGLNILLFDEPRATRRLNRQIDVWWSRDAGNLAFSVALLRFITRAAEWEHAEVNVLLVGDGSDDDAVLRAKAARYLDANRVDAKLRIVVRPDGMMLHELVRNQSSVADLVLLGLPHDLGAADRASLQHLAAVVDLPGGVVFVHAGAFADVLVAAPVAPRIPRVAGAPTPVGGIPSLALPEQPELAAAVTSVLAHTSGVLTRIHDRIGAAYGLYLELCTAARALVVRRADTMLAAAAEPDVAKRRKLLAGATNEFLTESDRALAQITAEGVAAQATLLAEVLREATKPEAGMPAALAPSVRIERPRRELAASAADAAPLRAWKRRQRGRYFYRRTIPQTIALRPLAIDALERILIEDGARVVERFRIASHELAVEIGRVLATAEWKAHAQLSLPSLAGVDAVRALITTSRDDACARLEALAARARDKIAEDAAALDAAAHASARSLAGILGRVDAPLAARHATRTRVSREDIGELPAIAERWRDQQLLLLARARLGVRLARFRDRLTIASARALGDAIGAAEGSGTGALVELRARLAAPGHAADVSPEPRDEIPYDGGPIIARLTQSAAVLTGELPDTETLVTDDAAAALLRGDTADDTLTVPVRAAVQALVESELLARFAAELVKLAEADARAWAVARETLVLVSARPRETDDDEAEQPEAFDAVARLDAQLAKQREVEAAVREDVLGGLGAVAAATVGDELSGSLVELGGKRVAVKSPSRIVGLARRGAAGLRDVAANMVYRRSAGVVYAQAARAARGRSAEHTIRELSARSTVHAALPLYYRNLFTGQININESFLVGRAAEVRAGVDVVTGARPGSRVVLVTGERSSGKTTLCQQIASAASTDVFGVAPPPGGGATRAAIVSALETSLGRRGSLGALVGRLPEGALLVFDDLALWWERRPGGLEALDTILELIEMAKGRVGFVLGASAAPLRVLGELRHLGRIAQAQLDCTPLPARALEQVVMARHKTTGIGLRLAGRESLGAWTRARLFDAHFAYARGNVGYALRSWVTHVEGFAGDVLAIRTPRALDWDALDDLRPEYVALLIELVLHKAASAAKLERLTGRPASAIADGLAELTAIGLVVQNRRRIAQLNPYVHVPVLHWLQRRELA